MTSHALESTYPNFSDNSFCQVFFEFLTSPLEVLQTEEEKECLLSPAIYRAGRVFSKIQKPEKQTEFLQSVHRFLLWGVPAFLTYQFSDRSSSRTYCGYELAQRVVSYIKEHKLTILKSLQESAQHVIHVSKKISKLPMSLIFYKSSETNIEIYAQGREIGAGTSRKARLLIPLHSVTALFKVKTSLKKKYKNNEDVVNEMRKEGIICEEIQFEKIPFALNMKHVEEEHRIFSLSDWCERGTLHEFIRTSGPSHTIKTRLLYEVSLMLQGLHKIGYCHLDISLGNILVKTNEFGQPTVQVCDFAYSIFTGASIENLSAYPAPEMIECFRQKKAIRVLPSLDAWAFGVVCAKVYSNYSEHTQGFNWQTALQGASQLKKNSNELIKHIEKIASQTIFSLISGLLHDSSEKRMSFEQASTLLQEELIVSEKIEEKAIHNSV